MKKIFISFATFVAASVLMSSCSNDESTATTTTTDQLTAFTGGIVTEVPMERVQIGTSGGSTVVPGITTRTSMNRGEIKGDGSFLWEPNDVIYVEDDNNQLCKGESTITDAVDRTTFLVYGSYTGKNQYDVYYCGTNSGVGEKKVVIAGNQTQAAFNNTKHFGAAGDCGVATAEKATVAGKSGFKFELEHKASYLCFLPYMALKVQRANFRIQRIEITSNNNISGTYGLTQAGLSNTGTNESKTITLDVGTDGLLLANQTAETPNIDNSLYVVIAPGTHALKVKYTVLGAKNTVMTITKSYKSHNFGANKICNIPVDLGVRHYSGHNYYMWDAAENYWSGHEWDASDPWQPITSHGKHDGYPKSKAADPSRWYHEGEGSFEASVNSLFTKLPNANEIGWYVQNGDGHWDDSTWWEVFGELHHGGIWLKKLSVIAQEIGKEPSALKLTDPFGKDLRVFSNYYFISPKKVKPKNSEIDKYFFLPALGYYHNGEQSSLRARGLYWSSSAYPGDSSGAYGLSFYSSFVYLHSRNRSYGFVAQPFE